METHVSLMQTRDKVLILLPLIIYVQDMGIDSLKKKKKKVLAPNVVATYELA